jgi:serine/threonine-protein kinase
MTGSRTLLALLRARPGRFAKGLLAVFFLSTAVVSQDTRPSLPERNDALEFGRSNARTVFWVAGPVAALALAGAGWLVLTRTRRRRTRRPFGALSEESIALPRGSKRVTVERKIAQGGLCNILAIRQSGVSELRVLKILREEFQSSTRMRSSVKEEGRILKLLNEKYPGEIFVRIFEDGAIHDPTHGEVPYLILEYIEGEDLRTYVRKNGPLPAGELLDLVRTLLRGLELLHAEGYVHGDVSPENLMRISRPKDPGNLRWRLLDFGEAKRFQNAEKTGEITGKPEFISPEQARGFSATPVSDMYSLGMVIYFLQTGVAAFRADNPSAILKKHEYEDIVFPPSFPAPLKRVVTRLTAKLPLKRATASAVLAQLDAVEKEMR